MDISNDSRLRWRWCHLKRPRQSRRMLFPLLSMVSSFWLISASCVHCLSLFCCVVPDAEALEAVFSFEENPKGLPAGVVYQALSPLLPVGGLTVCRGCDMFGVFPLLFSCPWVLLNLPRVWLSVEVGRGLPRWLFARRQLCEIKPRAWISGHSVGKR